MPDLPRLAGRLTGLVFVAFLWVATSVRTVHAQPARHVRIHTAHGAIHVWTPAGYDPETAALLIYVHGYFANVDDAWRAYHLRDQFAESGLNAMFVACEAPQSARDDIDWTSYAALIDTIAARVGHMPQGKQIVMGHSGAHRTIGEWLSDDNIDTIALLDAGYGKLEDYSAWLDARADRRLIDVAELTRTWTDPFHASLPESYVVDRFPSPDRGELPRAALDAQIVYVHSHLGHMPLVTGGVAIPMVLRTLEVPLVANAKRTAPIKPLTM